MTLRNLMSASLLFCITLTCQASQQEGSNTQDLSKALEWLQLPFFVRADISGPQLIRQAGITNWLDELTQPWPWFRWGGQIRLRHEYLENAVTISKDHPHNIQSYQRYLSSIWGEAKPFTNFTLYVRLLCEPRLFFMPFPNGNSGWYRTYGLFDQLYADLRDVAGLPLDLRIGRQNIILGDGWLVAEGTPLDGSRTYFFDAFRATLRLDELNTKADVIYVDQGAWNDTWLPLINHEPEPLATQDERGVILQTRHQLQPWLELGQLFAFKHNYHPLIPHRRGVQGDIYTYGPRVAFMLSRNVYGYAEGAYQWGEVESRDVDAFGFNCKLAYKSEQLLNSELWIAYEYLSGDDPNTRRNEEFNLIWGEWPRWSELMLYVTGSGERQVGFPTNLQRIGLGWDTNPIKPLSLSLGYHAVFAVQPDSGVSALNPRLFSREGDFRGHLAQGFIRYQLNRYCSAHLWIEALFPGSFYRYQDPFLFFRAELKMVF